ncbi:MAG: hypothetical protein WA103_01010 [Minisyncoccales bacterium]
MEMTLLKSLLEYKRARGFVWICQEFFGPLGKEPEKKRYYKYLDHLASVETYRLPATMWPFTAIEARFDRQKREVEKATEWLGKNSATIASALKMDAKEIRPLIEGRKWGEIDALFVRRGNEDQNR